MNETSIRTRVSWVVLVLAAVSALGLVFEEYVYEFVVAPVALVFLLIWRIVQSVDQSLYWAAVAAAGSLIFFFRLLDLARRWDADGTPTMGSPSTTLESVRSWRRAILLGGADKADREALERNLRQLIVAFYASRHPAQSAEILEALTRRQIAVPEPVYSFLFAEPVEPKTTIRALYDKLRRLPLDTWRRWSGRDQAEYDDSIDHVLNLLETQLEPDIDDKSIPSQP